MKRRFFFLFLFLIVVAGLYAGRFAIHDTLDDLNKPELPEAVEMQELEDSRDAKPKATTPSIELSKSPQPSAPSELPPQPSPVSDPKPAIPAEFNLAVPFTPQAPHGNWEAPFKEACEEASVYMASLYFAGVAEGRVDPDEAASELKRIAEWENAQFGSNEDTDAAQTAELARAMFGLNTLLVEDPTVEQIKEHLAGGRLVIVPAAGKQLLNPYYRPPGPPYHMLVVRGYTKTHFITNDPGTRRGEEYLYPFDRIMTAMHDWNGGDVEQGRKVILVVSK